MAKEFGTSEFSLTKLHQLSTNSQDTTAQHFFRRQMREYYFEHFKQANEHFSIPTEQSEPLNGISWEQLEAYCNLPFEDMEGNKYRLKSSRTNSHNGFLTIDFQATHPVTDERGKTGDISGHLAYDKDGRLKFGHQNRFIPQDPLYLFTIDYHDHDNRAVALGEYFTPNGEKLAIPIENMPFLNGQFLIVDIAEVMRRSR